MYSLVWVFDNNCNRKCYHRLEKRSKRFLLPQQCKIHTQYTNKRLFLKLVIYMAK